MRKDKFSAAVMGLFIFLALVASAAAGKKMLAASGVAAKKPVPGLLAEEPDRRPKVSGQTSRQANVGTGGDSAAKPVIQPDSMLAPAKTGSQARNVAAASAGSNAAVFTLAALAPHDLENDCLLAYKGKVYDVSRLAAWANCRHHGAAGGTDITGIFPHQQSYFDAIPQVGVLAVSESGSHSSVQTQAKMPRGDIRREEKSDEPEEGREEDASRIEFEED